MKKIFWWSSMMLDSSITVGGCATKRDLAKVQSQEMRLVAKADQAAQDAQAAKATGADTATLRHEAAATPRRKCCKDGRGKGEDRTAKGEGPQRNS